MAKATKLVTLNIADIEADEEFQMRVAPFTEQELEETVQALRDAPGSMERVKITHVAGTGYILTDGFRRVKAHQILGLKEVQAIVKTGSLVDATIEACNGNAGQVAKPITREDKHRAVTQLINRVEANNLGWSAQKIADALAPLGITKDVVATVRAKLEIRDKEAGVPIDEDEKVLGRDNKKYPKHKEKPPDPKPAPSLSEGTWENTPLDEFLDCEDYVWEALNKHEVKTAGECYKRIIAGEQFGLRKPECLELLDAIKELRDEEEVAPEPRLPPPPPQPEKEQGTEAGFPWREFDIHFGYVTRGIDTLAAQLTNEERIELMKHNRAFFAAWEKVKARLNGAT